MIIAKPEDRPFILSRRLKELVSPTIQKKEIRAFRVEKGRKFNLDPLNTIMKATKLWMKSFNLKSRLLKSSRMPIKIIKREQIRYKAIFSQKSFSSPKEKKAGPVMKS